MLEKANAEENRNGKHSELKKKENTDLIKEKAKQERIQNKEWKILRIRFIHSKWIFYNKYK